jgi:hypothetical protein
MKCSIADMLVRPGGSCHLLELGQPRKKKKKKVSACHDLEWL